MRLAGTKTPALEAFQPRITEIRLVEQYNFPSYLFICVFNALQLAYGRLRGRPVPWVPPANLVYERF